MSCATIGIGPVLRARGKVISPGNAYDATLPRLDFRRQPQPPSYPAAASYFVFIISHRPKMDGFELNAVSGWLRFAWLSAHTGHFFSSSGLAALGSPLNTTKLSKLYPADWVSVQLDIVISP